MAYSSFSLEDIKQKFGVRNRVRRLFKDLPPLEPSSWLKTTLSIAANLPVRTEKAKSEAIVFPVLAEMRVRNDNFFTIYSGDSLNVDEQKGLNGECDFILAREIGSFTIDYPILQVVEAKKNDFDLGVPQCAAQLIGAKLYNEKQEVKLEKIYGCVTTGDEWIFIQYDQEIVIDTRKYYLNELGEILAVFQHIIDYYKAKNI